MDGRVVRLPPLTPGPGTEIQSCPPRSDLTDSTVYWAVTVVTIMPEYVAGMRGSKRVPGAPKTKSV